MKYIHHIALLASLALGASLSAQPILMPDPKLQEVYFTRRVNEGCKIVAIVSIDALEKVGKGLCVVPEPTQTTKLACAVGLVLEKRTYKTMAVMGSTAACNWAVKKTSDKVVEISIETREKGEELAREIKAWFAFLNTFEGAVWMMNKF